MQTAAEIRAPTRSAPTDRCSFIFIATAEIRAPTRGAPTDRCPFVNMHLLIYPFAISEDFAEYNHEYNLIHYHYE